MAARKKQQKTSEINHTLDSSFKLKKIVPLTEAQIDTFEAWDENFNLFLYGSAGSGKSYISLYLALQELLKKNSEYHKIYIIRSAVEGRAIGFLPGDLNEKIEVFTHPYIPIVNDLFGRGDAFEIAKQKDAIRFLTTSHLRGLTFDNCIIIVDEVQNMNYEEAKTVITRVGKDTKIIFCGDIAQNDLYRSKYDTSGMDKFMNVIDKMDCFEMIEFCVDDIVRSGITKEFILAELEVNKVS